MAYLLLYTCFLNWRRLTIICLQVPWGISAGILGAVSHLFLVPISAVRCLHCVNFQVICCRRSKAVLLLGFALSPTLFVVIFIHVFESCGTAEKWSGDLKALYQLFIYDEAVLNQSV